MRVIDSHTGGEPTRVVIEGGPVLGSGPISERVGRFRQNFDEYRCLAINEPRGHTALVGALLCEPEDSTCAAGVIFFNNTGYLGMCGHGAIGVVVTLAYLGKISPGIHRLETPVGVVEAELVDSNQVALENVASFRHSAGVRVDTDASETVTGDIAWGGNWFFLVEGSPYPLTVENIRPLTDAAQKIRARLRHHNITRPNSAEIDHIGFFGPPSSTRADSRNFVLCPGGAWDRSPCGTGTSARLACLAADKRLGPGDPWVQESTIGSRFTATFRHGSDGRIIPHIVGHAYVCAEATLIRQADDPFLYGTPAQATP